MRLVALLAVFLSLTGCGGGLLLYRDPACLEGPAPHVGLRDADESIARVQREWERAQKTSPFVRARMIEALRDLSPDVSDRFPAPRCDADLNRRGAEAFAERPLPFSRVLVAQLRTSWGVDRVLDLIDLPETSITPYSLGSEESGTPPSRRLVHYLALLHAPDPWNYPESKRRLREYLSRTRDTLDLLILHGLAVAELDGRPVRPEARLVATGWIQDISRRLAGPPDRIGLELVLSRIFDLGRLASRVGIPAEEMRALLGPIVAKKGELPLTRGIPQGAHDLAEIARDALYAVENPPDRSVYYEPPSPRRERFDFRHHLGVREPANGLPSTDERRSRLRDLDGELGVLRMNHARCWVMGQIVRWSPPDEGARRFDALVAPIFDGDRIRFSTETLCRISASLDLEGVDDQRREKLMVDLLSSPPEHLGARDMSADGRGAIGVENGEEIRITTAPVLSRHLDLIERAPDLRSWLEAQAVSPVSAQHGRAHALALLQPAFERVIALDLASDQTRETGRKILRSWMESIRVIETTPSFNIYPSEVMRDRIRALGDFGRRADLVSEIEPFLREERKNKRAAAVAAYLLTL